MRLSFLRPVTHICEYVGKIEARVVSHQSSKGIIWATVLIGIWRRLWDARRWLRHVRLRLIDILLTCILLICRMLVVMLSMMFLYPLVKSYISLHNINSSIISSIECPEGRKETIEMIGPTFLKQLNSST